MKDLPAPLHVEVENITRILNIPDIKHLLYEVRYLNKYIEKEFLFRIGLSFYAGRSDASVEKIVVLEAENNRSQTLITEKEATLSSLESLRVIKDFKKSIAFKTIIQDHCIDEEFILGFLKGVRLVQRKIGVKIEGLTPSHASDDSLTDSDGDGIESEL
ncbi:hypothetical protein IEQ34_019920 [Dendrobium chrysotoxum]|uniref:Uncharacterized protein n=1 Tax=Dendrobium chrysotoxum TaxID=161865 RepID=A0AAV7G8C0_DENCH|nr:hypothetical protein IEQ34_019920 [Dendrobium chrysotoxum]